jgi:hypothetical protein
MKKTLDARFKIFSIKGNLMIELYLENEKDNPIGLGKLPNHPNTKNIDSFFFGKAN